MPKKAKNLIKKITPELIKEVATSTYNSIKNKGAKDVLAYMNNRGAECNRMYSEMRNGTYTLPTWVTWKFLGHNGKVRDITTCDFYHRVMMTVLVELIEPRYLRYLDPSIHNCIRGHGINCKNKNGDPNYLLRRTMQSSRRGTRYLVWDIKKCYASVKYEPLKIALAKIVRDKQFVDIWMNLSFCDKGLPIGSPISPINQHLILMQLVKALRREVKPAALICYADDGVLFGTTEQVSLAQKIIRSITYDTCQLRLKNKTYSRSVNETLSFLGYTYTRRGCKLNKKTTKRLLKKWPNEKSRSSYLGYIAGATNINYITKKIKEKYNMDISNLIGKIKIDTPIGFEKIDIKSLIDKEITIVSWDARLPRYDKMSQTELNELSTKQRMSLKSCWCIFRCIVSSGDTTNRYECKTSSSAITELLHKLSAILVNDGYTRDHFNRFFKLIDGKKDYAEYSGATIVSKNEQYYLKQK